MFAADLDRTYPGESELEELQPPRLCPHVSRQNLRGDEESSTLSLVEPVTGTKALSGASRLDLDHDEGRTVGEDEVDLGRLRREPPRSQAKARACQLAGGIAFAQSTELCVRARTAAARVFAQGPGQGRVVRRVGPRDQRGDRKPRGPRVCGPSSYVP